MRYVLHRRLTNLTVRRRGRINTAHTRIAAMPAGQPIEPQTDCLLLEVAGSNERNQAECSDDAAEYTGNAADHGDCVIEQSEV